MARVCDNSNCADIEATVSAVVEALGGLDVLVNNAGIEGPPPRSKRSNPVAWDTVLSVNVTGTFDVIPHLEKSASSSCRERFGYPNRSPYCVAKWVLIGFAKTLAIELGAHNIRANAIAPGAVGGDRIENVLAGRAKAEGTTLDEARASMLGNQSIKRFVDPKEIALRLSGVTRVGRYRGR